MFDEIYKTGGKYDVVNIEWIIDDKEEFVKASAKEEEKRTKDCKGRQVRGTPRN